MISKDRILEIGDALYRESKRISREEKVDFESATIRFFDLKSWHEFAYTTEMYTNTYTARLPDWDKDMWSALIRAGIRYYQERSKFSIDKIYAVALIATNGYKCHIPFP